MKLDHDFWAAIGSFVLGGGLFKVLDAAMSAASRNKRTDTASFEALRQSYHLEFNRFQKKVDELNSNLQKMKDWNESLQRQIAELTAELQYMSSSLPDLPIPMAIKSSEGTMLALNNAYEREFLLPQGFSRTDYIGHTDSHIWGDVIASTFAKNDAKIKEGGEFDRVENEDFGHALLEQWYFFKYPIFTNEAMVAVGLIAIPKEDIEKHSL